MPAPLATTPQIVALLSDLVESAAGLHYDHPEGSLFTDRVASRAVELGYDSLLDYYYFLRYDPDGPSEVRELIENLVVQETFFFRELDILRALVDFVVVPGLQSRARMRIWCSACATGEEPLTLAILLAERGVLNQVELVATDISERALEAARRGVFPLRSLRVPLPPYAKPWLDVHDTGITAHPRLLAAVHWQQLNLMDAESISQLGQFDLIICRNVLIYFCDETVRRVVRAFNKALTPHGVLSVGVSESLLRLGTGMPCDERGSAFVYGKS